MFLRCKIINWLSTRVFINKKGTRRMKKYVIILSLLVNILCGRLAFAEPMDVDLGQMFSDYKDNEYAFLEKYIGRDLKFTALVSAVRADCYTSMTENNKPCIELEHKTYKVAYLHVIPTNIGKAFMNNDNVLADLHKKQEITLVCRLREASASLVFEQCQLIDKKTQADENNKGPLETTPEEASKAVTATTNSSSASSSSSSDDYDWTFWIILFIIVLLFRK